MQSQNKLKITLYEIILDKNTDLSDINKFHLSISFNSTVNTTDKISINSQIINFNKSFNFEIPKEINETLSILINALGTSWMFFNREICSCEINYKQNLYKFNDEKKWYSMKNKENKEIMKILVSIYNEENQFIINNELEIPYPNSKLVEIPLFNTKSSFINNSSISNSSFDEKIPKKLNNTIISRPQRVININKISHPNLSSNELFVHLTNDSDHSSLCKKNIINKISCNVGINKNKYQKKNTFQKIDKSITKMLSSSLEEKDKDKIDINKNNLLDENKDENIDINNIKYLLEKYEKEGGDKKIINKYNEQLKFLIIKEEKLNKERLNYIESINKLKEKNNLLNKEKQQLDKKISLFKKEQNEFEEKNIKLEKRIKNFEKEKNDFNVKENIEKNNKDIFYNLNYYITSGNNIPLRIDEKSEINNKNNVLIKTSVNDLIDSLNMEDENNII